MTCSISSRCWPVLTTTGSNTFDRLSAAMTGAILMASGRVPMKTAIRRMMCRLEVDAARWRAQFQDNYGGVNCGETCRETSELPANGTG